MPFRFAVSLDSSPLNDRVELNRLHPVRLKVEIAVLDVKANQIVEVHIRGALAANMSRLFRFSRAEAKAE